MSWTIYKIRRRIDGLFSTGGSTPSWSKKGKTWAGLGPLSNHLNLVVSYQENRHRHANRLVGHRGHESIGLKPPEPHPYEDAEIVRYVTAEDSVEPVMNFIKVKESKKEEEKKVAILKQEEAKKKRKLEQLRELQEWADKEGIKT